MSESTNYEIEPKRLKGHSSSKRNERQKVKKKHEHSEDQALMDESRTVIMDNGAYSIKIGLANQEEPQFIPNCIMKAKAERKRLFIGNQIDECRDCSGLYYLLPCERGYITKWDVQKPVWDHVFTKCIGPVTDKNVLMTQPPFNFKNIQDCIDEIFFEEYEVASMFRCYPSDLVALKYAQEIGKRKATCVVVDTGYSFSHSVPYINGLKAMNALKRLQIGGKVLTNHMKDIISYRQYHVMEETYVINQVKEDTCYVAEDFNRDLKIAMKSYPENDIVRNYILPDFNTIRRGYIQDPVKKDEMHENCQVLRLNNERFQVPEILFTPSDIGIQTVGLVDCIIQSIKLCPRKYHETLANNIVVVGGNALFPGVRARIIKEFQSKMPAHWKVGVTVPEKSTQYAWQGGKLFSKQPGCSSSFVTKKEYDELGATIIQKRFNHQTIFKDEEPTPKSEIKPISYIDHVKRSNVFNKTDENPEDGEPSDSHKIFTNDSPSYLNTNSSADNATSSSYGIFEEKTGSISTPASSEKSSEISVGSDAAHKPKQGSPQIKYFFTTEESSDEEIDTLLL